MVSALAALFMIGRVTSLQRQGGVHWRVALTLRHLMDLIALQGWLDNASFAVLLVTMLLYWCGAAFPLCRCAALTGHSGYGHC